MGPEKIAEIYQQLEQSNPQEDVGNLIKEEQTLVVSFSRI